MLRIPTSSDVTPPLLAPREEVKEDVSPQEGEKKKSKRRRSKKGGAGDHSWEKAPKSSRLRRGEMRRMRLILAGAGLLFLSIVGGVIYSMVGAKAPVVSEVPAPDKDLKPASVSPKTPRSDASVLAEAEPLARKFLDAKTVEEMLPWVRNPELTGVRMRDFYADGKIEPAGMSTFNSGNGLAAKGSLYLVPVQTRDHEDRALAYVETPQGLKIDWESWVGWSDIPWQAFLAEKPQVGHVFRVILSPVDYYNFDFSDDLKWQSYRIESPDKDDSLYGYVEKGSLLSQQIHVNPDEKSVRFTLVLKYPENPKSDRQVMIERVVCEGWVENGGKP